MGTFFETVCLILCIGRDELRCRTYKKHEDQAAIFTPKMSVSDFKKESSFMFNERYGFIFLKFEPLRNCRSLSAGGFITQLTCHAIALMGDGGRSGNLIELPGALARLWRGLACRVMWGGGEKDSLLPDSAHTLYSQ